MPRLRLVAITILALAITMEGFAVAQASAATSSATITGIVTVDGMPATGLAVTAWPEAAGQAVDAHTAASGQFALSVQADAAAGTTYRLDVEDSDPASHVVPVEVLLHVAPGQKFVQDIGLSTFDARLIATISDVPAGVSDVEIGAGPMNQLVGKAASYTPGQALAVNGLPTGDNGIAVSVGTPSGNGTNYTYFYYPGTTNEYTQTPLALTAGCTTSLAIDVAASSIAVSGRDCSRLPACQSAHAAANAAGATLVTKTKALTKAKKKDKKAKKHHAPKKELKKLKKKVKKATKAKKHAASARDAAAATEQSTCH